MAKAKFRRAEVIASATDLFWRQGYNSASMQDVFGVTGLQPGSLYNAFGSKEGLYEETLRFYGKSSLNRLKEAFDACDDDLIAFCLILINMVDDAMNESFKSCFLVKSQLELNSMGNLRLAGVASEQLEAIQNLFEEKLSKVYDPKLARQRAVNILLAISGLRVIGFMEQCREDMLQSLESSFAWLPWKEALSIIDARAELAPVAAD